MRVQLEFATEEQVEQIAKIWTSGWQEAHAEIVPVVLRDLRTPKSFLPRVRANLAATCVATNEGNILGFYMVKGRELYQMYVAKHARGSGVAQALIKDAEKRIEAAGYKTAWLACAIGNAPAVHFYKKSGWSNTGRQVVDLDTAKGAFPMEVWRFEKQLYSAGAEVE
ncbi:MAG: GNAT family N-acetyltransferase [Pseudomonadota bacterium]